MKPRVFLFLIISLLHYINAASGEPVFLYGRDAFYPAKTKCFSYSQCDTRADSCDSTTRCCYLSSSFGYTSGTFLDFQPTMFSQMMPGSADGKALLTLDYLVPSFFPLKGFIQLWKYHHTESGLDIYKFTKKQEYVAPAAAGNVTVLFNKLEAGFYVFVYWDVGGTRFANCNPEMSIPYELKSVLPVRVPNLDITFDRPNSIINSSVYLTIRYKLTGPVGIENYFLNSGSSEHNRPLVWNHRSDQSNVINAKTTVTPEVGDTMLTYAFAPMKSGGMAYDQYTYVPVGSTTVVISSALISGRRTVISIRLAYAGLLHSTYKDYWKYRQLAGNNTIIAEKIFDVLEIENSPPQRFPENDNTFASVSSTVDRLTTHFVRDFGGAGGIIPGYGMSRATRELMTGEDYYAIDDDITIGTGYEPFNGHAFRFDVRYVEHVNGPLISTPDYASDYSCGVKGTDYAQEIDTHTQTTTGQLYNKYPLADVVWGNRRGMEWYGGCEQTNLISSTCDTAPQRAACECCGELYPNDDPTWNDPDSGEFQVCGQLGLDTFLYFGITKACQFDTTHVGALSPFRANNDPTLSFDCLGNYGASAPCVKDCAAGPRPAQYLHIAQNPAVQAYPYYQRTRTFSSSRTNYLNEEEFKVPIFLVDENAIGSPEEPSIPTYIPEDAYVSFGPDTRLATLQHRDDKPGGILTSLLMWTTLESAVYARYKVYPAVIFEYFQNARAAHGLTPATIDLVFTLTCENVELGWKAEAGFCAESWTVTNQDNDPIIVSVIQGALDSSPTSYAFGAQTLARVSSSTRFILKILYNSGDVLHWRFRPRTEPEKPVGVAYCDYGNPQDAGTPTVYTKPVPPKEYVISSMIAETGTNTPACSYSSRETLTRVFRGQCYIWEDVLEMGLIDPAQGNPNDKRLFCTYYYVNNIDGTIVQGFDAGEQIFEDPTTVDVYDHDVKLSLGTVDATPLPEEFPNPLLRPGRCSTEQAITSATCTVNIEDSPGFSGITQHAACIANVQQVWLEKRLILVSPYTIEDNIGQYYFNETTQFIDIVIQSQRDANIFAHINVQVVYTSSSWTLNVRYGKTIDSLLEAPCYERMITRVRQMSPFVADTQPIIKIPGCSRSDGCCYDLPMIVKGTSPITGNIIDMDNSTDACFGTPECSYEILVSPPRNIDGGLCLGTSYTFTVQSRQADVDARDTVDGNPFNYPFRCPDVFTETLPLEGLSPVDVLTIPGACTEPGTAAEFSFTVNSPVCSGEVSVDNEELNCKKRLYFALEADFATPYPHPEFPGDDPPSLASPLLLSGELTFTYNIPGTFRFPQDFIDGYPSIPNGDWTVHFWLAPLSGDQSQTSASGDPRNVVESSFQATLRDADGTILSRTFLSRPRCAGPDIEIGFVFYDTIFQGPYVLEFRTPSGRLVNSALVDTTTVGFRGGTALPSDPFCWNGLGPGFNQAACDTIIRTDGIVFTARVQTGNKTTGESGLYQMRVMSTQTRCNTTYSEDMDELRTLQVQAFCQPVTCPGRRDGNVIMEVNGGTQINFLNLTVVVGSSGDLFQPLYHYNSSTPDGPQVTSQLFRKPEGQYNISVTDTNGCFASNQCTITSKSTRMRLVPVSSTPPNCTGQLGKIVFRVINGTAPYTLMKVGSNFIVHRGWYELTDESVQPGVQSVYVVVDANGCVSDSVNFTLAGAVHFTVTPVIITSPCNDTSPTGVIRADVPAGLGTTIEWFNVQTGALVGSEDTLANVPAGTYRIVATSEIYGCRVEQLFDLDSRGLININFFREIYPPMSIYTTHIVGNIVSDNGPPYSLDILGLDPNLPPSLQAGLVTTLSGQVLNFEIVNLPVQTTLKVLVTDSGTCRSQFVSLGGVITTDVIINSPSPLPRRHIVNGSIVTDPKHETDYFWIFFPGIIITIFLIVVAFFYFWISNNKLLRENKDKKRRGEA